MSIRGCKEHLQTPSKSLGGVGLGGGRGRGADLREVVVRSGVTPGPRLPPPLVLSFHRRHEYRGVVVGPGGCLVHQILEMYLLGES